MIVRRVILATVGAGVLLFGAAPGVGGSADGFEAFQQQRQEAFAAYQRDFQEAFEAFQETFAEELAAYREELRGRWHETLVSDRHRWVEYSEARDARTIVDYQANRITVEVPEEEGTRGLLRRLDALMMRSLDEAYARDEVTRRTAERVGIELEHPERAGERRVLSEITPDDLEAMMAHAQLERRTEPRDRAQRPVLSLSVPMPEARPSIKAREYQADVQREARRYDVDEALILAIMHSESSFNPMARSHIPAYGLMQIVPETAGIDVAQRVYGEPRLLSPEYLYNPRNNIRSGTVYLDILQSNYLAAIEDPESRMYAVIAAYNTGAGNVARAFVGRRDVAAAVAVINGMTPEQVYARLRRDLPYSETRDYLVKVASRTEAYRDFY
ncbi:hypothetical protein CKO15_01620 [Halorhodospira abdelmalekii]|uniref:transglycosylase SLT domain-containing protein n=1 Tax=Halorhodospira abdelmalekii TaxID=421629 RepID=UPI0019087DDB|nr:transglycosylase SLT domain-containing protein [Halorhodospira abdelmalekii]MBK1733999.1 hypothetical protein [Halorhodospira abdelmalekii]